MQWKANEIYRRKLRHPARADVFDKFKQPFDLDQRARVRLLAAAWTHSAVYFSPAHSNQFGPFLSSLGAGGRAPENN